MKTLLTAAALCTLAGAASGKPFALDSTPGQLPKTVLPVAYAIDIVPDLERAAFSATEDVTIEVRQPTDHIVLNQSGLTITGATLDAGQHPEVTEDEEAQTATFALGAPLPAGRHRLHIAYSGPIPQTPNGIYRDDYKAGGRSERMLVTQFEVADARRMFPGWDEPVFKATYQLTVTLPDGLAALSNTPEASRTPAGTGLTRIAFAETPTMSSYLVALLAGHLDAVRGWAANTDIAVWSPAGEAQRGAYALSAATSILPFYNAYFATAYPLPKLDLIAVAGNYQAGAMENWGAITYIDNALLFDPKTSSPSTRETIYLVVAHEMAHQWSGDLVTMAWWDDIWLNEGFATWMENKATDRFNPEWQIWPRQHDDRERAMAFDAKPSTHPLHYAIHDPSEANTMFDLISYQKGSQIIRMLEDWLGPDTFRDGLRAYMRAHAYASATSADLWAALEGVSHQPVGEVASGFVEQPGIPLISVATACRDNTTVVTLAQSRFALHDTHPKHQTWQVPVDVQPVGGTAAGIRQTALVGDAPVELRVDGCVDPVKVNAGENGYFRTLYDAPSLSALSARFASLNQVDKANLLGDEFALFESGQQPLATWLDLLSHLADETSYAVWHDTLAHIARLDQLERGQPSRDAYRHYARALLNPQLDRLGWTVRDGEPVLDTLLRPEIIVALGQLGDPLVAAQAASRYDALLRDPAAVPPALQEAVLLIVGMHADQPTWTALRQAGEASPDTEHKLRYFEAMGAAHEPSLIDAYVQFAASGAIPNGRIDTMLHIAALNDDDPDRLWSALLPHQAAIRTHLATWSQGSLLPGVASLTEDPASGEAMLADASASASSGARIEAARAMDTIGADAALVQRVEPALAEWLRRHQG